MRRTQLKMLDLSDFITERGGDPKRIKESQRKRNAPEESVDEVIALFEQARNGMYDLPQVEGILLIKIARYEVTKIGAKVNEVQKSIGMKKKVGTTWVHDIEGCLLVDQQNKEDASELIQQKTDLEEAKKKQEATAAGIEKQRDRKIRTIGNYVHDSVPVSADEVRGSARILLSWSSSVSRKTTN